LSVPDVSTHMCFGCSPANPIGFKLNFTMQDGICRTTFTASKEYQGWNGFMHGGLIATLLDETMAQWLWLKDIGVMTAEMTTRYSLAVPVETPLTIESEKTGGRGRLHIMEGKLLLPDGRIAVRATGKFLQLKPDSNLLDGIL